MIDKHVIFKIKKQIDFTVGWAVVWLVVFGEGCDVKGRVEHAVGREPRGQVRVVKFVSHLSKS